VETYVRGGVGESSESVTANLEDSFLVFQLFQNQQDITDEKMSNNSLLINKQQIQQVDPSGLSHEDSQ
jgi:hypothetical protein